MARAARPPIIDDRLEEFLGLIDGGKQLANPHRPELFSRELRAASA